MSVHFRLPEKPALVTMANHFREVRKRVFEEATQGAPYVLADHERNKGRLKANVVALCERADLRRYDGLRSANGPGAVEAVTTAPVAAEGTAGQELWHLLWSINRYAGIRSRTASREIADIRAIFDRREQFDGEEWDIEVTRRDRKPVLLNGGTSVHDFLNRKGAFADKQTVGNLYKLRTIVSIARKFGAFLRARPSDAPVTHFITNGIDADSVREIHSHLVNEIGYRADLTALHLMMDMGLPVIKPDIVVTRLFLQWGWLKQVRPDLPHDLTFPDLQGKGSYGSRYVYTRPSMYWPVIELARAIVKELRAGNLEEDLGWVSTNLLREFDIFVVKFGQRPEPAFGIVRKMADWTDDPSDED